MIDVLNNARSISGLGQTKYRYSICTSLTRPDQYRQFLQSFLDHGFNPEECEYLYVDNSVGNKLDGYEACNVFLQCAQGEFVILAHQDVLAVDDDKAKLDQRLRELTALDPRWGVCGNAGTSVEGVGTARYTDGSGEWNVGPFPNPVVGLDENFLIVRRAANLAVSPLLSGYHFYGTELCFMASALGLNSYVIDFHVNHNSAGHPSTHRQPLLESVENFVGLRSRMFRPTIAGATSGIFFTSRWKWANRVVNRLLRTRYQSRVFRGLMKLGRLFP